MLKPPGSPGSPGSAGFEGSALHLLVQEGETHLSNQNHGLALQSFAQALALDPKNARLRFLCGEMLYQLGDYAQTVQVLQDLDPADDVVLALELGITLGRAQQRLGQTVDAELNLMKAFVLAPDHESAAYNLAVFYELENRLPEALPFLQAGIRHHPSSVPLHYNLGSILLRLGHTEAAEKLLRQVLVLAPHHPKAHHNLALLCLSQAAFTEGWTHYAWRSNRYQREARSAAIASVTPALPLDMTGVPLEIQGEQGIGDELFFMRFLPLLKQRGAQITYRVCNRKLATLMPQLVANLGVTRVLAGEEGSLGEGLTLLAGDLPLALGMNDDSSCPPPVWLTADPTLVQRLRAQHPALQSHRPKIGLSWRAGTQSLAKDALMVQSERSLFKSVPLENLLAVLAGLKVELVVLQRNPTPAELHQITNFWGPHWMDASHMDQELDETLALLSCLDALVGVSNTNVHLFAGVGGTGDVLVPSPAEFRWQLSGDGSPWFPGFRVHRQAAEAHWNHALASLRQSLLQQFGAEPT